MVSGVVWGLTHCQNLSESGLHFVGGASPFWTAVLPWSVVLYAHASAAAAGHECVDAGNPVTRRKRRGRRKRRRERRESSLSYQRGPGNRTLLLCAPPAVSSGGNKGGGKKERWMDGWMNQREFSHSIVKR